MADINIKNFYRHIAKILSILYESFPSKTPVFVDDVAGIDSPDEYGLHRPNYTAGFLHSSGSEMKSFCAMPTRFDRMVLTRTA